MPVLDWTRTDLDYRLYNNTSALRFSVPALAAFDLYILECPEAVNEFTPEQQTVARAYMDSLSKAEVKVLTDTILAGLRGTDEKIRKDTK